MLILDTLLIQMLLISLGSVTIPGMGNSAVDIAVDLCKVTSKVSKVCSIVQYI